MQSIRPAVTSGSPPAVAIATNDGADRARHRLQALAPEAEVLRQLLLDPSRDYQPLN
jgi:hypothetical protein